MTYNYYGYFDRVFASDDLVERCAPLLEEHEVEVLVGAGMSGVIAVTTLGCRLGLPFLAIRKDGVSHHGTGHIVGTPYTGMRWAFVDDILCSGATSRRVRRVLRGQYTFAGALFYQMGPRATFYPPKVYFDSTVYNARRSVGTQAEYLWTDKSWRSTCGYNSDRDPQVRFFRTRAAAEKHGVAVSVSPHCALVRNDPYAP